MQTKTISAFATAVAITLPSLASAEIQERQLEVVGGDGTTFFWSAYEKEFWEETLPAATDGKITANAVPYSELGLGGFETLRLMRLGTYDVATPTFSSAVGESPELEGFELPGLALGIDEWLAAYDAYKPVIERELAENFNAKLLMFYPWPGLDLFCNFDDENKTSFSLDDLQGKKIRAYSTPSADFIEALGGTPVTVSFSEVITSLQRGTLDCAMTAQVAAEINSIDQVASHYVAFRTFASSGVMVISLDVWNDLSEEAQTILMEEVGKLEDEMLEGSLAQGEIAYNCLEDGPCERREPGGMTRLELSEEQKDEIRQRVQDVVVKRWAERCGTEQCVQEWNDTIGEVLNTTATLD